jgi:hypothetical protein
LLLTILAACNPQPVKADPLTPDPGVEPLDVGPDLASVLQHDETRDACKRWEAGHKDRRTTLLCGKWMFFYETFGTLGVPAAIPKFLVKEFPDEIGPGFEKLGMIRDPNLPDDLPVGLVPGRRVGLANAVAFTCASCHFARLPDGRYAVGGANHDYEFGKQLLAMTLLPTLALMGGKPEHHDPDAVALVKPMLDRVKSDKKLFGRMGVAMLKVLPAFKAPKLDKEIEHAYASWPPGAMDFLFPPMKIDDHVHIVGKILPLWSIPNQARVARDKMPHAMLGWAGAAPTLMAFTRSFIQFGDGDEKTWTEEKLQPIVEYIDSLRAPKNPERSPTAFGAALFRDKCIRCHGGPGLGGERVYALGEVGTDAALERWLDPDASGKPCCKAPIPPDSLTHGIKSPRLVGLWTEKRFLHNGTLNLRQLFCLEPRPPSGIPGLETHGHDFTCKLTPSEKEALIAFLEQQ